MPEAVIVTAVRSPIGRAHRGSLAAMRPDDLAAQLVRAALDQVPALDVAEIDDLILGCGLPCGEQGHNLARVVAVLLGLDTVPGTTVTRCCSSSLQSTRMALHAIRAGEGDVFISAGVEAISRFGPAPAGPAPTGPASADPASADPAEPGQPPGIRLAMGQAAENVARARGITREEMDRFGVRSHQLAEEAIKSGFFDGEIISVALPDGTFVSADDGPCPGVSYDTVCQLEPAFQAGGLVTEGNCCPLNDGAAALVVMSDTRARALGVTPLARIVSTGVTAQSPEVMGLGPVEASQQALNRAGMTIDDVDLVEINEASAAQVIPSARDLGLDPFGDKLNVHGGAIALGHPYGMTGARITATLLNGLRARDRSIGLETMCVGGGQGMAMIFERLS
jgi:acetyl-CoA C-acetyltransferase